MSAFSGTTLAILAGGKGSRLGGAAKGLLEVDGVSCIGRQLTLGQAFAEVLLLTADPRYAALGARQVADVLSWGGPVAGLHAALAHARAPAVLLTACDMPFLSLEVLELLLSQPGRTVAFETDGALQPLPSLWRVRAEDVLVANQRSLRGALQTFSPTRIPEVRLRKVDPDLRSLVSLNTPDDLARFGVTHPPT